MVSSDNFRINERNRMSCSRQRVTMNVRGTEKTVWKGGQISPSSWHARTYINGKTVSGVLRQTSNGALRFTASGKNASLMDSLS